MEILLGLILSLTAAVVGVWHIAGRDRPLHGPVDDGTLGLPHLQRFREARRERRFDRIRRALPFVEVSRLVVGLAVIIILGGLAAGLVFGVRSFLDSRSRSNVDERLGEIVSLRARANAASDPATRYSLLTDAADELDALIADAPEDAIESLRAEQSSLLADLDRIMRVTRLETLQPVGRFTTPAGVEPQLLSGPGATYLLAGSFYEINVGSLELVQLLAPGAKVDGVTVGQIAGATMREDGPVVIDSERAYAFDRARGEWDWEELGDPEAGEALAVQDVDVFDFNLYLLDQQFGRILKYTGGDYQSTPEDWTGGTALGELQQATDLAIDGNIYVLLPDSKILTFYLSALDRVLTPQIMPPFDDAQSMDTAEGSEYFYIVNSSDGRIARVSKQGELVQQFVPSEDSPALVGMRDIVVDEGTGIALLVTGDGLFTTRLPPPPDI